MAAGSDNDDGGPGARRSSMPGGSTGVGSVVAGVYRIVAPLDEGGIGTVWLAEYGAPPQRVAVKLLRPQYAANAEVVARFEREAGAMAGLVHENIARAFDFGRTAAGELYMVMEYVEGESLRAALNHAGGWFPLDRALVVARQIASALARAHSVGVVHRDLKPENIIVADAQGAFLRLKILDFGMARVTQGLMASGSPLTRVGSVFGTPAYMAPEQAMAQTADARADQYALGVICFEMLAGRRPYVSESPLDVIQMHVRAPIPPLAKWAPHVPAPVVAVIERMMAKDPAQRFPDVAQAVDALVVAAGGTPSLVPATAVAAQPIGAVPPSASTGVVPAAPAQPVAAGRRAWGWVIAAAVGVLAIVVLALAYAVVR